MITKVVKSGLCTFCGSCYGVCETDAVKLRRTPSNFQFSVDEEACTKCGLCKEVCPGLGVDYNSLSKFLFGKGFGGDYLGHFKRIGVAFSQDKKIRVRASSGGFITTLLKNSLQKNLIDAALVTGFGDDPLVPEVYFARTAREIENALGSKYCPVPLNAFLKQVRKEGFRRIAVVGLPCHIHGIRKIQMADPYFREVIKICIGLFCGQTVNFSGTEKVLKIFGVDPKSVRKLEYRGGGWPGYLRVLEEGGKETRVPYFEYFKFFNWGFFVPPRCFLCPDNLNDFADIAVGDAWLPNVLEKDRQGTNLVIIRTGRGEHFFDEAKSVLEFRSVRPEIIRRDLHSMLISKKEGAAFLSKILKVFGTPVPHYGLSYKGSPSFLTLVILGRFVNSLLSNRFRRFFLKSPRFLWIWGSQLESFLYKRVYYPLKRRF